MSEERNKEIKARKVLEARFGVSLPERETDLITGEKFKFDLVSEDLRIIGDIKSNVYKNKHQAVTQSASCSEMCLWLLGANVTKNTKKILVLTDEKFYNHYSNSRQGKIAKALGIEIIHIPA